MVDFVEARNQICELVYTGWQAGAGEIAGYVPSLFMPRVPRKIVPPQNLHWAQLSLQSVMSNQAAFAAYGEGKKKYEESGLIFVQLFGPRSDIEAAEVQDKLAKMTRRLFRGTNTPGKVWFRRARVNDVPPENEMLRLNVVCEYEYYDIG